MRNIIKHPFINLIFFVALFAFSGCTNEMELVSYTHLTLPTT